MGQNLKRAWCDTKTDFGWNTKTIITAVGSFACGLLIRWLWKGWEAMIAEVINYILFGLGTVIVGFLLLFAYHLVRAPVYLKFEKEKEPKLKIVEVKEANYQRMGETHGLVIENEGTDIAEDCRGELIEIEFANPERGQSMFRYPVNHYLTWAEQEGSWDINKTFTIPGKDSKVLRVIIFRSVDGRRVVEIAYSANQDIRINNAISHVEDVYMVISVTSLNRLPIYAVCRYRRAADTYEFPKLILLDVTKDKPTISFYQKLDFHKGGSQS